MRLEKTFWAQDSLLQLVELGPGSLPALSLLHGALRKSLPSAPASSQVAFALLISHPDLQQRNWEWTNWGMEPQSTSELECHPLAKGGHRRDDGCFGNHLHPPPTCPGPCLDH